MRDEDAMKRTIYVATDRRCGCLMAVVNDIEEYYDSDNELADILRDALREGWDLRTVTQQQFNDLVWACPMCAYPDNNGQSETCDTND